LELDRLPGTIIEGADPGLHELTIEILKVMTLQLTLGQPTSRLKLRKSGQQVDHECHSVRQSGNLHLRTWVSLDEFSLKRRGDLHLDVSDSCAFCQGRIISAGLLVVLIRSGCSYVDEEGRGGRGLIK
jgi:hypothetical protein